MIPVITQYCRIRERKVIRQGVALYQNSEGNLDNFLDGAFQSLGIGYAKFHKMDRLSKLGFLASEVLLKDRALTTQYAPEAVALVLSNSHSSLDTDIRYLESVKTMASPALFVYTLPNIVAGEICIRQGIKGENAFFISETFDAGMICDYVNMVMATEKTQACIAGWVDVMDDHHDVFLYLVEKQGGTVALDHVPEQLLRLY